MREDFLLKTDGSKRLYQSVAKLPIIDFHNHLSASDITADRRFENICSLWLEPDPYKHRLMRICGVNEHYVTGDAEPFEKFQRFCEIFPFIAGNPVYDWSRMELSSVFGIKDAVNKENARRIYDTVNEKLASPEYSTRGILSRFNIEYQSPVVTLLDDLSAFEQKGLAPSIRADELLCPAKELIKELSAKSGVEIIDRASYLKAVCVMLDGFDKAGCIFADHSLDAGFFAEGADGERSAMLSLLANEYAKRGWTMLLHMNAKRKTSPRLLSVAGPAGGYAAAGESLDVCALADLLGRIEDEGLLPDTVLFSLNMNDQAPLAVLQGSYSQDGVPSKVQLGPAWWWCDHALGIENTLSAVASFGVVSQFIGMTTDSRSILSFVRHDYFRRILCSWLDRQNTEGQWQLPFDILSDTARRISYQNAKDKTKRRSLR